MIAREIEKLRRMYSEYAYLLFQADCWESGGFKSNARYWREEAKVKWFELQLFRQEYGL